MSSSKNYQFINILGVPKNGTTLLGSLIDEHREITSFALELKLVHHYLHTIKKKNFKEITKFFKKSKISFLNNKKITKDKKVKIVTGNVYVPDFDLKKFNKILNKNYPKNSNHIKNPLKEAVIYFHNCLDILQKKKKRKKIVIQDGCFGLDNIEFQRKIFKDIKNLVIIRNPLDVYVSYKKNTKNFSIFRRNIYNFLFDKEEYNYSQLNKIYKRYKNSHNIFFFKYEDLVENPRKQMKKIASFLQIRFTNSLIKPTIFGKEWFGNASSLKEKKTIDKKEVNKYKKSLNIYEINYIIFFYRQIFNNFKYQKKMPKINIAKFILSTLVIYFQNILEVRENSKQDYKYFFRIIYYIIFINNLFLFNSIKSLIIKNNKNI